MTQKHTFTIPIDDIGLWQGLRIRISGSRPISRFIEDSVRPLKDYQKLPDPLSITANLIDFAADPTCRDKG